MAVSSSSSSAGLRFFLYERTRDAALLRCDAAARMLKQLLIDQFQLADARIEVSAGGPRGMRVNVTLLETAQSSAPAVQQALDAYLFEAKVQVG